jgi:hypothetical protein
MKAKKTRKKGKSGKIFYWVDVLAGCYLGDWMSYSFKALAFFIIKKLKFFQL